MLGISPDDAASHRKFKAKFGLRVTLLVDDDHAIAKSYGVWVMKNSFGVKRRGITRTTFIIDPTGRIAHVFDKVTPLGHAAHTPQEVKVRAPRLVPHSLRLSVDAACYAAAPTVHTTFRGSIPGKHRFVLSDRRPRSTLHTPPERKR